MGISCLNSVVVLCLRVHVCRSVCTRGRSNDGVQYKPAELIIKSAGWTGRQYYLGRNKEVYDAELYALRQTIQIFDEGREGAALHCLRKGSGREKALRRRQSLHARGQLRTHGKTGDRGKDQRHEQLDREPLPKAPGLPTGTPSRAQGPGGPVLLAPLGARGRWDILMQPAKEDPARQVLVVRAGRATDPPSPFHQVRGPGGGTQDVERGGEGLREETP